MKTMTLDLRFRSGVLVPGFGATGLTAPNGTGALPPRCGAAKATDASPKLARAARLSNDLRTMIISVGRGQQERGSLPAVPRPGPGEAPGPNPWANGPGDGFTE